MAQFYALTLRHKMSREHAELLMGIETATLANHSANPPKKAYSASYFMPSKQHEKAEQQPKPKRFNRQKFAQDIRSMMRASHLVRFENPDGSPVTPP